jgi:hypothetical protein
MIKDTFTTITFPTTRFIGAVAIGKVLGFNTFFHFY